jgi:hypothetical protein
MIDPAHMPILLAQVSEFTGAAEGLSKGGAYFIAAVLAGLCWSLYRENRALHEAALKNEKDRREEDKATAAEKLALVKELHPLAQQLASGVVALERIADKITKE